MPHQQQNSQKDVQIQPKTNPKLLLIEIWASVTIFAIYLVHFETSADCFTVVMEQRENKSMKDNVLLIDNHLCHTHTYI